MSGEIITRLYSADWELISRAEHDTVDDAFKWVKGVMSAGQFVVKDDPWRSTIFRVEGDSVLRRWDLTERLQKMTVWPSPYFGGDDATQ